MKKKLDKKQYVKNLFDNISGKYDFLNHFLSVGIDFYWRKKSLKLTKISIDAIMLDVACGTGDFSIAASKIGVAKIIGADLSRNMLKLFNSKAEWSRGKLAQSIAEFLPFKNQTFTNITVAFGVRNFYNIPMGFNEFYRILKKNGKVTVLEFSLPKNLIIKGLYNFYFNHILPTIGKLISKDNEAYTYLPKSVNKFDAEIDVKQLLSNVGFKNIENHSLTFGLVQVVIAEK